MNSLGPDPFVDGESSTQAHDGAEPEPWWGKQAPTYIAGYYKATMCTMCIRGSNTEKLNKTLWDPTLIRKIMFDKAKTKLLLILNCFHVN